MYKVEYLVIVDVNSAIKCTNVNAIKSLIQSDSDITIQKSITHRNFTFEYDIVLFKDTTGESNTCFKLKFSTQKEDDIVRFNEAIKSIRRVLSVINKQQIVLWDDITLYYSEKAYPKIYIVENLMRKLLSQFMLLNLGIGWTKDRVPTDVEKSINSNNADTNFLHNVDFIQLSVFLFSENYPTYKDNLLKKLKQAKNLNDINIEEIKSLVPETNWEKFFEEIVECEGGHLKKQWNKLYDLRCKVAHNKTFTKFDLDQVDCLTSEVGGFLESAIKNLESIVIPESEKENVAENVAFNRSEDLGNYIICWRDFENVVERLFVQLNPNEKSATRGILRKFESFLQNEIIGQDDYVKLNELVKFRNIVVHGLEIEVPHSEIKLQLQRTVYYTDILKRKILDTDQDHLDGIVNPLIRETYDMLKNEILKFGDVRLKSNKYYITFVGKYSIADIHIQKKALKLWLNLHSGELEDVEGIAKDVSKTGHWGSGDYELQIKPGQDLKYIYQLIQQSYHRNRK